MLRRQRKADCGVSLDNQTSLIGEAHWSSYETKSQKTKMNNFWTKTPRLISGFHTHACLLTHKCTQNIWMCCLAYSFVKGGVKDFPKLQGHRVLKSLHSGCPSPFEGVPVACSSLSDDPYLARRAHHLLLIKCNPKGQSVCSCHGFIITAHRGPSRNYVIAKCFLMHPKNLNLDSWASVFRLELRIPASEQLLRWHLGLI